MPEELWTLYIVHDIVQETGIIDYPQEKEMQKNKKMQKSKMAVFGGLTNSCENKRSQKQRRKGRIYLFGCTVPKNRKVR